MAAICIASEKVVQLCAQASKSPKLAPHQGFSMGIHRNMPAYSPHSVISNIHLLRELASRAIELGGQGQTSLQLTDQEFKQLEWAISGS
jgi:hypothetical protein